MSTAIDRWLRRISVSIGCGPSTSVTRSTRTTSAPRPPSSIPQKGAGPSPPIITMRVPASGPRHRFLQRSRAVAASSVAWVITWLRFSSSIAAARSGASVFTCNARLVNCTPSGEWAAIRVASSSARSSRPVVVDELADEPGPECLGGVDGAAREHPVGRDARPDDARQEVAHAHLRAGETDRDGGVAERRRRGADADVGRQAQREPAADRGAVHRGDHRLGQRTNRLRERAPSAPGSGGGRWRERRRRACSARSRACRSRSRSRARRR